MKPDFVYIDSSNRHLVKEFIDHAGKSLSTFRYFEKRSMEVLNNHLVTFVLRQNNIVIGYGHLDKDGEEKVWLGTAVIESFIGKGYGRIMVEELIKAAKEKQTEPANPKPSGPYKRRRKDKSMLVAGVQRKGRRDPYKDPKQTEKLDPNY